MAYPPRLLAAASHLPVLPAVLLGYMAGDGAALLLRPQPLPSLWPALLLLALLPFCLYRPRASLRLMPLAFVLLGWQLTALHLAGPSDPLHVARQTSTGQAVTLLGTVTRMPEFDGRHSRFLLDCEAFIDRTGPPRPAGAVPQPARGLIRLTLAGPPPAMLQAGQRLMVMTRLESPRGYRTPGAYDSALNLASQAIFRIGYLTSERSLEALPRINGGPWKALRHGPERIRHDIARAMDAGLSPATAALYQGLVIGTRANIPQEVIEDFKASGCMHILAISGMHLSLLALMIGWTLTWIMQRSERLMLLVPVRSVAAALTLPPLLGYTLLAGGQLPVLRALVMSVLVAAALLLRRPHDLVHLLGAAALGLLLWQPLSLATASFQLSFAAVLALILVQKPLQELLRPPAPESPALSVPPSLPRRCVRSLTVALLVSLTATLGTLPIMLHHFNQFSLVGPLANLLVEPLLCLWSLPLGLLAIVCLGPWPELGQALLALGGLGIEAAMRICHLAASLPLARLYCPTPFAWEIGAYYVLLALLFWRRLPGRSLLPLLCLTLLAGLLPSAGHWLYVRLDRGMTVWYLDVGQGSATVIELPGGKVVLVDGGGSSFGPSVGERVIAPFLWRRRHLRLEEMVLTHADSDHSNGLDFVLRHFRPRHLWISTPPAAEDHELRRLLDTAERLRIPVKVPDTETLLLGAQGATLRLLNNPVRRQALARPAESRLPSNETGLVLRLSLGQAALLFPGDIGAPTEARVAAANPDMTAQVLLAAHHGSRGSNSPALLAAVRPAWIVVSAGHRRGDQFPAPSHRSSWEATGITTFITGRDGALRCRVTDDGIVINPCRAAPSPLGP